MKTKQTQRYTSVRTAFFTVIGSALLTSCALCQGGKQTMPVIEGVQWAVSDIDGRELLTDSLVTMNFSDDGRVSGKASCNGYSAVVEREGSTLKVSKLIQTKRYCHPSSLMEQEQRFSTLLSQATSWAINEQGQLVISTASGNSITAQAQE